MVYGFRARPIGAWAAMVSVLGGIVPIAVLQSASAQPSAAWVVQTVVAVHAGVMLARTFVTTQIEVMQLAFWLFGYVWLGVAPLLQLVNDTYPWGLRVDASVAFTASLLIEVGFIAYTVGLWLGRHTVPKIPELRHSLLMRELSLARTIALGVVAIAISAVLIPRLGGLSSFFSSRQDANAAVSDVVDSQGQAGTALLEWGLAVPAFWALMAFLHVRRRGEARGRRQAWAVLVVPVILLNVIVNNPISQPRFWAGTVILALVFSSSALTSVRNFRVASVVLLIGLVVLFPVSDYYRTSDGDLDNGRTPSEQMTENPDYDAYQQVQAGALLVDTVGHQPKLALAVPFFWVPRTVWPDKPEDAGVVIGRFIGYRFLNLSAPLWVESYIWGGMALMFALFATIGLATSWLDQLNHMYRKTKGNILRILVPALGFYQFILLRGSLLQAMAAFSLLATIPFLITRPSSREDPSDQGQDVTVLASSLRRRVT